MASPEYRGYTGTRTLPLSQTGGGSCSVELSLSSVGVWLYLYVVWCVVCWLRVCVRLCSGGWRPLVAGRRPLQPRPEPELMLPPVSRMWAACAD